MIRPDLDELEAYLMDRAGYPATIEIGGTVAKELLAAVRSVKGLVTACREAMHALIEAQCDAANVGGNHCEEANQYEETIEKLRATIATAPPVP